MVRKKGTWLFWVIADILAEKEEEHNRWYNEEHLDDLLALPGFLDGARYVAVSGAPKHLSCFELEGPYALAARPRII